MGRYDTAKGLAVDYREGLPHLTILPRMGPGATGSLFCFSPTLLPTKIYQASQKFNPRSMYSQAWLGTGCPDDCQGWSLDSPTTK